MEKSSGSSANTSGLKRTSWAAELDQDPTLSSSRRQTKSQSFLSQMALSALEKKVLLAQEAQNRAEEKLREKEKEAERLGSERRFLADREREEKEEKERTRVLWADEKRTIEQSLQALRSKHLTLQSSHEELKDSYSSLQWSSQQTVQKLTGEKVRLEGEVGLLKSDILKHQEWKKRSEREVRELQGRLDGMKLEARTEGLEGEVQAGVPSGEDAPNTSPPAGLSSQSHTNQLSVLTKELSHQSTYIHTLESSNAKLKAELAVLREKVGNAEVLREEKRKLQRMVEGVERLRSRVGELENERDELKARVKLDLVKEDGNANSSSTSRSQIQTQELVRLRHENASLLEKLGTLNSTLSVREAQLSSHEDGLKVLKEKMERTKKSIEELEGRAVRAEMKVDIERREVGWLKGVVASLEAERDRLLSTGASARNGTDTNANVDSDAPVSTSNSTLTDSRITTLEQSMEDLKSLNERLEKQLGDAYRDGRIGVLEEERKRREVIEHELQQLRQTSSTQLDQIDGLEQKLFDLQGDIASGSHVPPGVRVLQLKENPLSEWEGMRKSVVDGLKKENEALLERLKRLEKETGTRFDESSVGRDGREGNRMKTDGDNKKAEEGGGAGGLVPMESYERLSQEKTVLEEVVAQRDKRLLRLQQVFTSKSHEFREAITSILGFNLAFYPNGQVRVTSQYDVNATFVFQPGSKDSASITTKEGKDGGGGMKMQLIGQGQGGPEDLPQLLRYWVEQEACIPGFMASVTLECWEKMKRSGS